MIIKIISDGTPPGTKIIDAETGEAIEGCESLDIHASLRGVRVTAVFTDIPFEVVGRDVERHELTNEPRG